MREDNRTMTDVVNELQTKLTTIKTTTDQKLQSMRQQVLDGNLNLDAKFLGKFAAFEQRGNDQHESSMEKISMVEVMSTQKEAGFKKRFEVRRRLSRVALRLVSRLSLTFPAAVFLRCSFLT
jgi:hypothetical protein